MRLFLWRKTLFAKMWTVSLFIFFYLKITEVFNKLPVIRVKEESQNGCHKKTKHAKFSEKRTFSPDTHKVVRNVCFSESLASFDFL